MAMIERCTSLVPPPKRRIGDIRQVDSMRLQAIGIDEHLKLPVVVSPDGDIGHARDRHQSRANRPPAEYRHVHLRQRVGPQPDFQSSTE